VLRGQPPREQLTERAQRCLLGGAQRSGLSGELLAALTGVGQVAVDGDRTADAAAADRVGPDADADLPPAR
jgi:hypothetical protein